MGGSVERLLEVLVSSSVTDTMKNGYHVVRPRFHVQLQRPDLKGINVRLWSWNFDLHIAFKF